MISFRHNEYCLEVGKATHNIAFRDVAVELNTVLNNIEVERNRRKAIVDSTENSDNLPPTNIVNDEAESG